MYACPLTAANCMGSTVYFATNSNFKSWTTVEALYNEVLGMTNDFLYLSDSKIYEKEP